MGKYCSVYCKKYDNCDRLGILDYMAIIPKHPSELNKNWCGSFVDRNSKED